MITAVEIEKILGVPFCTWFLASVEPDDQGGAHLYLDKDGLYQTFVEVGKEDITLLLNIDYAGMRYSVTRRIYLPHVETLKMLSALHHVWHLEVGLARKELQEAMYSKENWWKEQHE